MSAEFFDHTRYRCYGSATLRQKRVAKVRNSARQIPPSALKVPIRTLGAGTTRTFQARLALARLEP
jgi:hypothetical protein